MNIKQFAIDFAVTFALAFVVTLAASFLYSLIVHGSGVIDWETAFRFGITLGVMLPWIRRREKKQNEK